MYNIASAVDSRRLSKQSLRSGSTRVEWVIAAVDYSESKADAVNFVICSDLTQLLSLSRGFLQIDESVYFSRLELNRRDGASQIGWLGRVATLVPERRENLSFH